MPQYTRYVALGDSQTEGLNDGDDISGYRGWADRLAEQLAAAEPGLRYANLAVRGRLAAEIHDQQLAPALALRPDLVTVLAGMNDLVRTHFDAAAVAGHLEAMFAALTASGAHVATVLFPDIGKIMPVARSLRPRVLDLNERIRGAAARHGVTVFDPFSYEVATDSRIWSPDRLHANSRGHALIAAGVAYALRLPGSDDSWTRPLPPQPHSVWRTAEAEFRWFATYVAPWLVRRVTGRSTGHNRVAKRPTLEPVTPVHP
jgi:lysophospholipase L1-like esterase